MTTAGNSVGATVTSRDGLVHATLDATGALADLEFAPTAFERTDPSTLAHTVLDLVRQGSALATQRADATAPPVPPRPTPKRARHAR